MHRQPWWSQLLVTGWLLAIATGLAFTDRFEGLVGGIVGGVIVHWLPPQQKPTAAEEASNG